MIDIHNHILIGVDDGPQSEEAMLALLKQAHAQGIKGIVATPHHLHPRFENEAQKVMDELKKLRAHPIVQQLDIQLYPGQEVRITDEILKGLDQKTIIGINHSRYLLIEFPSNEVPLYTKRLFFELQQRGHVPIIAHPERNKAIMNNPELLYELVSNGALSQLTAGSLLGTYGKTIQRLAHQLMTHHLTHVIASDAHATEVRPFQLQTILEDSKLKKDRECIQDLIHNGTKIVEDKEIKRNMPLKPTSKRKKFLGLF
ncbi:tyrosine-protein phosphatase [Staphylococcus canis]|uniref:Tyrosine-protein phosphatase n=1 Tax=Staphylococcus canis TaxID=2724942 RepID=A0ABS0TA17_9STAP|nr:CpsB/CapC family capsule biosynthesis tyrosine phosphatase [Staphylococcus canis]MBI5975593.1 capsular biosynthesis protein [Staphylococcus canis]